MNKIIIMKFIVQIIFLRLLNKTKVFDKIETKSILENFNMLLVNQMNPQAELTEIWKSVNVQIYPLKMRKN